MNAELPPAVLAALDFEQETLPNGLCVRLARMPGYGAVHAMYAANFGSIDRAFERGGETVRLPAGTAHFLEHKMFESEGGADAFSLYAKTGASANAYTGFDRTAYVFTATDQIERNLDILLSFVGRPHFTPQSVERERGIIAQEIGMYEDSPEMRSLTGALECLYSSHPVRDEIAGTVESIGNITPELLRECCDAYYTPANMVLCAAGDIGMPALLSAVDRAGLPGAKAELPKRILPREPLCVARREHSFRMPVAMPVFTLGFKEAPARGGTAKTEVVCDLLCELLFGETGALYRRLYDEGLVQPEFAGEYGCYRGCLQFLISGESENPQAVRRAVLDEIALRRREGIDTGQLELCKRMMYGEAVADLESVERAAHSLCAGYFRGRGPAEELAALAAVTPEDVEQALACMLSEERSAFLTINP